MSIIKVDIKNALELFDFRFNDTYHIDKCLSFGSSISRSLFEKCSTFLEVSVKWRLESSKVIQPSCDFLEEINLTGGPCEGIVYIGLQTDCV